MLSMYACMASVQNILINMQSKYWEVLPYYNTLFHCLLVTTKHFSFVWFNGSLSPLECKPHARPTSLFNVVVIYVTSTNSSYADLCVNLEVHHTACAHQYLLTD